MGAQPLHSQEAREFQGLLEMETLEDRAPLARAHRDLIQEALVSQAAALQGREQELGLVQSQGELAHLAYRLCPVNP